MPAAIHHTDRKLSDESAEAVGRADAPGLAAYPTPAERALSRLTAQHSAILASDPAIRARFDELLANAATETPRRSVFWMSGCSDQWEIDESRLVRRAAYEVLLGREEATGINAQVALDGLVEAALRRAA